MMSYHDDDIETFYMSGPSSGGSRSNGYVIHVLWVFKGVGGYSLTLVTSS